MAINATSCFSSTSRHTKFVVKGQRLLGPGGGVGGAKWLLALSGAAEIAHGGSPRHSPYLGHLCYKEIHELPGDGQVMAYISSNKRLTTNSGLRLKNIPLPADALLNPKANRERMTQIIFDTFKVRDPDHFVFVRFGTDDEPRDG